MPPTPTRRPVPDDLFGGRLKGTFLVELEVVAVTDVRPRMRAITFTSPDLYGFEHQPGQDLMLSFPNGERPARRRYTIRSLDPDAGTAVLEFVLHGDGPAARWALQASPGDRLEGIGPRGTITARTDVASHVFVADASAVPATFAMTEALPPEATALIVLATEDGWDERDRPAAVAATTVHHAAPEQVPDLLATLMLPPAPAAAYVNGEHGLVREAKDALVARGFAPDTIATKAYWRRGQANADHGEPRRD